MRKIVLMVLVGMLSGKIAAAVGGISHTIQVPYQTTAPVVDGTVNPGEYDNSMLISFVNSPTNPGALYADVGCDYTDDDKSAMMYMAYTVDTLYFGFDVTDDFVDNTVGDATWNNDNIEIFIDGDQNDNDFKSGNAGPEGFQILVDSTNQTYVIGTGVTYTYKGVTWPAGGTNGYTVEIAIPLASIDTADGAAVANATFGDTLRFNVGMVENDYYKNGFDAYGVLWHVAGESTPNGEGEPAWRVGLELTAEPSTNTIPYSEDFESYAAGFDMSGTNGWSAGGSVSTNADSVAALTNYSGSYGYPGGITNHTKLLEINGTVTNSFTGSSQQVWVDMMLQPGAVASTDAGLPSSANAAFYFNTSGHPMVYHYDIGGSSNRWTEIPETTKTNWVRATTGLDYATEYFQIKIDGNLLTNALAYTAHDGSGAPGGSWFKMPNSSGQLNRLVFSGITGGYGYIDDLIVALADPFMMPIISGFEHVSGDVYRMVVDFPYGNQSSYGPIKSTDLVGGSWDGTITHSTNGVDGWLDTDMDYSVVSGSSRIIYLQSSDSAAFFALEDK